MAERSLVNMEIFTDNVPIPAGISPKEWAERKQNLKRKAWKKLIKLILMTAVIGEFIIWTGGGYEEFKPRRLDELTVVSGTFYYGGSKRRESGIANPTTGKNLVFNTWIYYPSKPNEFKGYPSTVWYYVGDFDRRCVYQLEVDGVMDFDLEKSNKNLERINRVRSQANLEWKTGVGLIIIAGGWWEIRRRYREALSKNSKEL